MRWLAQVPRACALMVSSGSRDGHRPVHMKSSCLSIQYHSVFLLYLYSSEYKYGIVVLKVAAANGTFCTCYTAALSMTTLSPASVVVAAYPEHGLAGGAAGSLLRVDASTGLHGAAAAKDAASQYNYVLDMYVTTKQPNQPTNHPTNQPSTHC